MTAIRILRSISGRNFKGEPFTYGKGAIVKVSAKLAKDLCGSRNAEKVKATKKAATRQTATSKVNKETR